MKSWKKRNPKKTDGSGPTSQLPSPRYKPGTDIDREYGIHRVTRQRWIKQGILPEPYRINGRHYFDFDVEPKFDSEVA